MRVTKSTAERDRPIPWQSNILDRPITVLSVVIGECWDVHPANVLTHYLISLPLHCSHGVGRYALTALMHWFTLILLYLYMYIQLAGWGVLASQNSWEIIGRKEHSFQQTGQAKSSLEKTFLFKVNHIYIFFFKGFCRAYQWGAGTPTQFSLFEVLVVWCQ